MYLNLAKRVDLKSPQNGRGKLYTGMELVANVIMVIILQLVNYKINTLCTLNLHNVMRPLCLNKSRGKIRHRNCCCAQLTTNMPGTEECQRTPTLEELRKPVATEGTDCAAKEGEQSRRQPSF